DNVAASALPRLGVGLLNVKEVAGRMMLTAGAVDWPKSNTSAPLLMAAAPVKLFAPPSTSVPAPSLKSPATPDISWLIFAVSAEATLIVGAESVNVAPAPGARVTVPS